MDIRKLTLTECMAAEALESLSFVFPLPDGRKEELEKENYRPDRWGVFDEGGKLTATLTNHDLPVFLDGRAAPARGVGGVASDPVSRGQGHVRAMFERVLQADRADGKLFSALYPFSHPFYRKFGYELCFEHKKARFPTDALKAFRTDDPPKACLLGPADSTAALRPVYDAFAKRYSFMAARTEHSWSRFKIPEPRKAEKYWYVLSRGRTNVAYVVFRYQPSDKPFIRTLCVNDFACVDRQAFLDLLGFLHRFAAQAKDIELFLPGDLPLSTLVENSYAVELTVSNKPMARALHVENVLKFMRHPDGDGGYSVYVEDTFLPENTGRYAVRYAADGMVTVSHTDETSADLHVSVQSFTQLVFGFLDLKEAAYKPDVRIEGNEDTLKQVFVKKQLFLNDFY